jgi:hypothetical protein
MKIAIIGSRSFEDYTLLCNILDKLKDKITLIISGGARGADKLAERYAKENSINTTIFLADWEKNGKAAGFIRNQLIIEECDACLAFWDGVSKGTKHSINLCIKHNKPHKIINYERPNH